MSAAGNRNRWIPGIVGLLVGVLLVILLVRGFRSEVDTVESISQYDLAPPEVQIERSAPIAKPSASQGVVENRETPTSTLTPKPALTDAEQLADITDSWIYRGYGARKSGEIGFFTRRSDPGRDEPEQFVVREGEEVKGVTIEKLDTLTALARLGDVTIALPMVSEQRPERMENYIKRGGPDPKVKRYTPRLGEIMPPAKPPTEDVNREAMKRYLEKYAPLMQKTSRPTPVPTFERYRRGTATPIPSED